MKRFFHRLVSLWKHTDKEVTEAELAAAGLPALDVGEQDAGFADNSYDDPAQTTKQNTKDEIHTAYTGLTAPRTCMNCDEVLTGKFCFTCGQKVGDIRRPIWSLVSELLDNVVAPDSKLFKTILLLLAVPGGLTRDYNRGMRARFIPPLRFYITITFLFFALLFVTDVLILDIKFRYVGSASTTNADASSTDTEPNKAALNDAIKSVDAAEISVGVQENFLEGYKEGIRIGSTKRIAEEADKKAAVSQIITDQTDQEKVPEDISSDATNEDKEKASSNSIGFSEETLAKIRARVGDVSLIKSRELTDEERQELLASFERALPGLPSIAIDEIKKTIEEGDADVRLNGNAININDDGTFNINDADFPYEVSIDMFVKRSIEERETIRQEDLDSWIEDEDTPEFVKDVFRGFSAAVADPREFNDLFNDLLPKILFFMVPFFALILRVFHWGNKRFYFNQLIFSLHFHSFLFLIFIAFIFILPVIDGAYGLDVFWWGTSLYLIIALKIGQEQGWIKAFLKAGFIWVSYAFILTFTLAVSVVVGLSGRGFKEVIDSASIG